MSKPGSSAAKQRAAAQAAMVAAYAGLPQALASLASVSTYKRMGVHLRFSDVSELSPERVAWVMALLKTNMEPVFGSDEWPAQERTRRKDAVHKDARYVFVHRDSHQEAGGVLQENSSPKAAAASAEEPPLGFVHYRFVVEEDVPVLYVYELQVSEAARGQGLGRFLMLFVELLAKRVAGPLAGVMLTIQRANVRALQFYAQKCKYLMDDISPSKTDPFAPPGEYDYDIYSKVFDDAAREVLKRKGHEARVFNAMQRVE